MLSTYCQQCGTKIEYRFAKPNFCNSCGQPLHGEAIAKDLPTQNQAPPPKPENLDEEGTDIFQVPNISNLEYEIEISQSSFTMGDLFKNVESEKVISEEPKRKRGRPRKTNGKTKKN
jgi:hypothetical protein